MDKEHHKHVCGTLREVNEDEHDLRSGRRMKEFEFPGNKDVLSFPCQCRFAPQRVVRASRKIQGQLSMQHTT